jgi:hypothetical protein
MDPPTVVQKLEQRILELEAELARERARSTRWWRSTLLYACKLALTISVAYLTARGCAPPPSRPPHHHPGDPKP